MRVSGLWGGGDGGEGGKAGRHTEDELLQRCEDVYAKRHLDLVDLQLQPLRQGRGGVSGCHFELFVGSFVRSIVLDATQLEWCSGEIADDGQVEGVKLLVCRAAEYLSMCVDGTLSRIGVSVCRHQLASDWEKPFRSVKHPLEKKSRSHKPGEHESQKLGSPRMEQPTSARRNADRNQKPAALPGFPMHQQPPPQVMIGPDAAPLTPPSSTRDLAPSISGPARQPRQAGEVACRCRRRVCCCCCYYYFLPAARRR